MAGAWQSLQEAAHIADCAGNVALIEQGMPYLAADEVRGQAWRGKVFMDGAEGYVGEAAFERKVVAVDIDRNDHADGHEGVSYVSVHFVPNAFRMADAISSVACPACGTSLSADTNPWIIPG